MTTDNKKSFWALMGVQFFGAFNDNVLKTLVSLLIVLWISDPSLRGTLVSASGAVFVAPFILFSMVAGRLSDRVSKPRVIVGVQIWQIVVVLAAAVSLLTKELGWMMVTLFLLSMQAAFFGPSKYGILPELMGETELSDANGLFNMATFVAILLGTVAGSFLSNHLGVAGGLLIATSILGLLTSLRMRPLPAAKPDEPWAWNPVTDLLANWRLIRSDGTLKIAIIAVNYFWFMGAILQLNIFLYAQVLMRTATVHWPILRALEHAAGHTQFISGVLVLAATVGIGLGSFLAGKLSRGKVELGLVPLGALGMSLFLMDLLVAYNSLGHATFDLFMIGLSGGLYEIPLNSLIQWRSPAGERGRVLATQNFLSFVAIGLASGALWLCGSVLHLNPAQILFALGALSLIGTAIVYTSLPQALWRFVLYILVNTVYRLRVRGDHFLPIRGPALLISNHLSLADGFLVGGATTRPIRFLIWRTYFEDWRFHWLMKVMKAIPISETDPPRQILASLLEARKALEQGELVCIFAEGQVSRTGNLLEFQRGFEIIVKGLDVPVIPVHLDRVWGSIFSFEHGKFLFKRPRKIPYPVTVTFGAPLHAPVEPAMVRQKVQDLGADDFRYRLEYRRTLPVEFLRQAKKHPGRLAVADSTGQVWSYGKLAAISLALAPQVAQKDERVGILLPPTAATAATNLAILLGGGIPVNLNYTAGAAANERAIAAAGIKRIYTSRIFLKKAGISPTPAMRFIEDNLKALSRSKIVAEIVGMRLLPAWLWRRGTRQRLEGSLDALATILFSSGSTGIPKGIMLSHANILSNCLALEQLFDVGAGDRLLGVLPFFHSFGYTATFWFPLIGGFSAIYHTTPLDAKTVGELAQRYRATLLLATPTFLQLYVRKCASEEFRHLRYVITGAERLRPALAEEFEKKFGIAPLEGYGATELSPVASVNVPDVTSGDIHQVGRKPGTVGAPLPGVTARIVHPESFEDQKPGDPGLLLIKGPNVMLGYLDEPEKTAAVMRDGWYVTGDIAEIGPDGFIRLQDRVSRFSKIGGEMVPHMLIEEKLQAVSGLQEPAFVVTAVADERRGERLVVLYLDKPELQLTAEALCKKLQASDLPKLWIPASDAFYPIAEIPILGTGKFDLAGAKKLALEKASPTS